MTTLVPVTVVIAARNEGRHIADCVQSASFAAEVLVVENDSTDETVSRAREAGAEVFSHSFATIGGQRNAGIARASNEWILVLDADERATAALGDELARRIGSSGSVHAWRLGRRNFFFGREIRHGGWERDRPIRFFRRTLRYDERPVHEHVLVEGAIGELDQPILHEPYETLGEYFEKLVRYSRDWAAQHFACGRRASLWSVVVRPPARFASMLILRGGWRDGGRGVLLAMLAAVSVAAKYALLWELGQHDHTSLPSSR
jgi:glycosyltransferase involved in cell wall biosynthesis